MNKLILFLSIGMCVINNNNNIFAAEQNDLKEEYDNNGRKVKKQKKDTNVEHQYAAVIHSALPIGSLPIELAVLGKVAGIPNTEEKKAKSDCSSSSSSSSTSSSSTQQKKLISGYGNLVKDIYSNRLSNISKLLNRRNVNNFVKYVDEFETPLSFAVKRCFKTLSIELILNLGANINQFVEDGRTPLATLLQREIDVRANPAERLGMIKNLKAELNLIHKIAKILWAAGADRYIGKVYVMPGLLKNFTKTEYVNVLDLKDCPECAQVFRAMSEYEKYQDKIGTEIYKQVPEIRNWPPGLLAITARYI